jgi:hypothetical protein
LRQRKNSVMLRWVPQESVKQLPHVSWFDNYSNKTRLSSITYGPKRKMVSFICLLHRWKHMET